MSISNVSGFTPLHVAYSPSAKHIIYARAHSSSKRSRKGKEAVLPEGRTLFLVNVPPDATERELVLFFKHAGTVERVVFAGEQAEGEAGDLEEEDSEEYDEGDEQEDGEGEGENAEESHRPRKKRKTGKGGAKPAPPEVVQLPSRPTRTFRKTGSTAHIIFTDESSLPRALALTSKKDRPWPVDPESSFGLAHYVALHASLRPPLDVVKAHANSWMALFDYEQAKKKQESKYKKGEAIVDEDGFTLVTRGGAYGQTVGGGIGVASKKFQDEIRRGGSSKRHRNKKKEPLEKNAFYAFQIHEKKRNGMVSCLRGEDCTNVVL